MCSSACRGDLCAGSCTDSSSSSAPAMAGARSAPSGVWWDSCAPGRARAGDRRERPDRVRGGELCPILDVLVLRHGWLQANPGVCLQGSVHSHSTETDLTHYIRTLTLKSGFYSLQSLRRGAPWEPTQRSPTVLVSFVWVLTDIQFDIRSNVQSNALHHTMFCSLREAARLTQ